VYKAVHNLGQVVALKVLPPSKAQDRRLLARFRREGELGTRLKNAHVVRTFQRGQAGSLHYLVMEYLEGETLSSLLRRRGRLPSGEALRLAYQVLLGLEYLHEHGVVHREVEPGNLLLVPAPGEDGSTAGCTVKILDLGQARDLKGQDPADSSHGVTREGELLGVTGYLAPEQAHDPRTADIRADLYGVGCVLYHALTGKPPFPDDNALRQIIRHASEAPKPLRDAVEDVPEGLQGVMDRLLAKDPAARYATPREAADALARMIAGPAVPPPSPPPQPHLDNFLKWLEADSNDEMPPAPPPPVKVKRRAAKRPAPPEPARTVVPPPMPEPIAGPKAPAFLPSSGRDWLMVVVAVGTLLVLQLLVWLALQLVL
jgi:serine/threonine protein kinase